MPPSLRYAGLWTIARGGLFLLVAAVAGLDVGGLGFISLLEGGLCTASGIGVLHRERFWRAAAAILVGINIPAEFGAILAAIRDVTVHLSAIQVLIFFLDTGAFWALTERRAHLAMIWRPMFSPQIVTK